MFTQLKLRSYPAQPRTLVVGYARPHHTLTTNLGSALGATTMDSFAPGGSPSSGPNKKGAGMKLYDPYEEPYLAQQQLIWDCLKGLMVFLLGLAIIIGLFLI